MAEIWKDIPNYDNLYQVSNMGRIKSCSKIVLRNSGKGNALKEEKILSLEKIKSGYLRVQLSHNKSKKKYLVHRLVALVFIENVNNKKQVNHKDSVRDNNESSNLEWVTNKENQIHSVLSGNHNRKLKNDDVFLIRSLYKNGNISINKIATNYNMSIQAISNVVNYKTFKFL